MAALETLAAARVAHALDFSVLRCTYGNLLVLRERALLHAKIFFLNAKKISNKKFYVFFVTSKCYIQICRQKD